MTARLALLLFLLAVPVVVGCGSPQAAPAAPVPARAAAFRLSLPDGTALALGEDGHVTVGGRWTATLEEGGQLDTAEGEPLAELLPDGRLSFRGQLTGIRVDAGTAVEDGVPVLRLADGALALPGPTGELSVSVPVTGASPEAQASLLLVVAAHLLSVSHARSEEVDTILAGDSDARVRVRVPIEGRPVVGSPGALVTIVMVDDFECPFCARAVRTLEELGRLYGDRVRFVFVHDPLSFHRHARDAATFAEEARAQRGDGGFWAAYAILFGNQESLERADLERYGASLGLDPERVRLALEGDVHAERIAADQALAERIGVGGTPAFFVNGIQVRGAQPLEVFRALVDAEIEDAERLLALGVPRAQLYARRMQHALAEAPQPVAPPRPERRELDPAAVYRMPIAGAPSRGPSDAPVTVVEVSDFQCPFCGRVQPTLEELSRRYGRDLRLVFRHAPLPFHDHAMPAAEAAAEAFAQRGDAGFWQMHDLLFEDQSALERGDLEARAAEMGLDPARFAAALDRHVHRPRIEADIALCRRLGATGTPAFFINGRLVSGARPIADFERVIDAELARARALLAAGTPAAGLYEALTREGASAPVYLAEPPAERAAADRVYAVPIPPGAPGRGAPEAPVTIQIFSDFQCPYCARVRPTVERILETYEGRVRVVWRHHPLPFHAHAMPAAEAALEVLAQRGEEAFWRFHDQLFDHQDALGQADLERYARAVGRIDLRRFRAALADHRHAADIERDRDAVREAGLEIGTPSFLVNGRLVQGARPFEVFAAAIDRALSERGTE